MFFMYHLRREIDLVPPWVSLGTKVSENVWQTAYTRKKLTENNNGQISHEIDVYFTDQTVK